MIVVCREFKGRKSVRKFVKEVEVNVVEGDKEVRVVLNNWSNGEVKLIVNGKVLKV